MLFHVRYLESYLADNKCAKLTAVSHAVVNSIGRCQVLCAEYKKKKKKRLGKHGTCPIQSLSWALGVLLSAPTMMIFRVVDLLKEILSGCGWEGRNLITDASGEAS